MKEFTISYEFDHKQWSATFHAENWKDAESRLAAMKATGAVFGELVERIPAQPGVVQAIEQAINTGRN